MGKKNDSSALATTTGASLATSEMDELFDGFDFGSDGLEEVDQDDIQLPVKVFNMKGKDKKTNRAIPPDTFFDNLTEEQNEQIDCVLLTLHKTREWREFDNEANKSVVHCRSLDRITGRLSDGRDRKCDGCPDAQWREVDGKRTRRCGEVYNFVGLETGANKPFVVRCKKTSLRPAKQYLNAHFIGALTVKGQRRNLPLFASTTKLTLKMDPDGKYAIPVFERGEMLDRATILRLQEDAKFYRDVVLPSEMEKISAADVDEGEPTHDKPNPNDFRDDDFVEDAEFTDSIPQAQEPLRDF